jgi:hypothetical protein
MPICFLLLFSSPIARYAKAANQLQANCPSQEFLEHKGSKKCSGILMDAGHRLAIIPGECYLVIPPNADKSKPPKDDQSKPPKTNQLKPPKTDESQDRQLMHQSPLDITNHNASPDSTRLTDTTHTNCLLRVITEHTDIVTVPEEIDIVSEVNIALTQTATTDHTVIVIFSGELSDTGTVTI